MNLSTRPAGPGRTCAPSAAPLRQPGRPRFSISAVESPNGHRPRDIRHGADGGGHFGRGDGLLLSPVDRKTIGATRALSRQHFSDNFGGLDASLDLMWVKLSDEFWSDPVLSELGNDAFAIYARALSYCGKFLTDGRIPNHVALLLDAQGETLPILVAKGKLKPDADGYVITNYLRDNPPAAWVMREREKAASRMRTQRAKGDPLRSVAFAERARQLATGCSAERSAERTGERSPERSGEQTSSPLGSPLLSNLRASSRESLIPETQAAPTAQALLFEASPEAEPRKTAGLRKGGARTPAQEAAWARRTAKRASAAETWNWVAQAAPEWLSAVEPRDLDEGAVNILANYRSSYTEAEIKTLGAYIASGGMSFFKPKIGLSKMLQLFREKLAEAREWQARGRTQQQEGAAYKPFVVPARPEASGV